jgi:hypothetical protein
MWPKRLFVFFSLVALAAAIVKIVFYIQFWEVPLFFFSVGLAAAFYDREFSIYLFIFLFPFINSTPALFDKGFSFNYMAPSLFLLSGIILVFVFSGEKGGKSAENAAPAAADRLFYIYYLFLLTVVISTLFVVLHWSNITLDSIAAVGSDTPVSPENIYSPVPLRISFGSIFPVASLFIYFISPYIFFYIKRLKPGEKTVFKWLSYGFYLSVALAVMQKLSGRSLLSDRLGKELKQFYGGFSDFNALGFFSGVMFLWSTCEIRQKNSLGYLTLPVSLAGCILSGSRTVFFFIAAGIFNLVYPALKDRKKQQRMAAIVLVVVVLLLIVFAGGTLVKRLGEGLSEEESLFKKIDAITNGRLWMTLFTLETVKDHFVSGVGTGTFTFYLAYKNYLPYKLQGEKYLYDLTLNHYLQVFAENGVVAFLCFSGFLVLLFRRSRKKIVLGTILFALLFNNFFWFPEAFLLFWIIAALSDGDDRKEKRSAIGGRIAPFVKLAAVLAVLLVILFNILQFRSLHPKTWAMETGFRYDYGFWYLEQEPDGSEFFWTNKNAGLFLELDSSGESPQFKLVCGAPLQYLEGKQQQVRVFWQGKLYTETNFTENKAFMFRIKGLPAEEGFLEIAVTPTFNEKKLGISQETRDLGVKFSELK